MPAKATKSTDGRLKKNRAKKKAATARSKSTAKKTMKAKRKT